MSIPHLRLAVSRTIALETPRGLRLAKEKTSHKIDVVVALAMAALHAVEQGSFEVPLVWPEFIAKPSGDYYGMPLSFAPTQAPHLDMYKRNWPTY